MVRTCVRTRPDSHSRPTRLSAPRWPKWTARCPLRETQPLDPALYYLGHLRHSYTNMLLNASTLPALEDLEDDHENAREACRVTRCRRHLAVADATFRHEFPRLWLRSATRWSPYLTRRNLIIWKWIFLSRSISAFHRYFRTRKGSRTGPLGFAF